ncbi:MAG: hypothetical protein ABIF87_01855 [Pseudomonadota bacterium]
MRSLRSAALPSAALFIVETSSSLSLARPVLSSRLKDVAGVVVGSFKDCGDIGTIYDIVQDNLAGRDIPVLAGFEIGHDAENLTVPIGLQATLDTESGPWCTCNLNSPPISRGCLVPLKWI